MALTEYTFGDLIELYITQNSDGKYGADKAVGINIDKEIRVMRGDSSRKELEKFYIVPPGAFVYNPRGSRKLGLGYNDTNITYITTFNNMIFEIKDCAKNIVLPRYLFMYLARKEWDRKAEFLSWGSSTEVFSWDIFCETSIMLPPLPVQQKYVDVYNSMLTNQRNYEQGLDDMKFVCEAFIDNLQRETALEPIGPYLVPSDERNAIGLGSDFVRGLTVSKKMIPTKADMDGVSLNNYKIVPPQHIAYVPDTSRRGDKVSLGMNSTSEPVLVSSISSVFTTDREKLLPEYLMLFFNRSEFDRYARFHSWGSARETFDWNEMCAMEIPIPNIRIQQCVINIYIAYQRRKEINERLKGRIRDICPILIKGSLEEGNRGMNND